MLATQLLAMTEGAGGLFDFNATLPLMAIQFVLLMVVLTFIFYKPVSKVLEDRELYISGNLSQASEKLVKADELYKQYDEQLKTAKVSAQATIAKAEKEAEANRNKGDGSILGSLGLGGKKGRVDEKLITRMEILISRNHNVNRWKY